METKQDASRPRRSIPPCSGPSIRFRGMAIGVFLLLLFGMAETSRGDRVILEGGQVIEGEILTSDTQRIFIRTEGGGLGILQNRISHVDLDTPDVARVRSAFLDLIKGQVVEGLAKWVRTARSDDPKAIEDLGAILKSESDRILPLLESLSVGDRSKAIESLEVLSGNPRLPVSSRFTCIRGLVILRAESQVATLLDGPLGMEAAVDPDMRLMLVPFWRDQVRRKLANQEYGNALQAIENLGQLDEAAGRSQRALWTLSRIGDARNRGDILEALLIAVQDLLPIVPEVAQNRIQQILNELPEWAASPEAPRERFQSAQALLEREIRPLLPLQTDDTLVELFLVRGNQLLKAGRSTETLELMQSTPLTETRLPLQNLAIEAEYAVRKGSLSPQNPLDLYRLGQWCQEKGRLDWAIQIYEDCLKQEAVRELARLQLEVVQTQRDSGGLAEAIRLYKDARGFDALEALNPILIQAASGSKSPVYVEAEKLATLIRKDLQEQSEKRPYQAEVIFQQAERAFFSGDYKTAIDRLAYLLRHYSDTPAVDRADQLLPQVIRTLELERIEGRDKPVPEVPNDLRSRVQEDTSSLNGEIRTLLDAIKAAKSPQP